MICATYFTYLPTTESELNSDFNLQKGEFAVIDSSIFRIKADLIVIKNVFKDEIHTIKQGLKHADETKWANEIKQVKD